MTELRPIRTDADYAAALREMEGLMTATPGSPESDRLEVMSMLVGAYEDKHFPIEPPDPVEAIRFFIDQGRLTQAELGRLIGSRARASEVLARKRRLTLGMIWRLHTAVGIPVAMLAQPYSVTAAPRRPVSRPAQGPGRAG